MHLEVEAASFPETASGFFIMEEALYDNILDIE